MSNAHTVLKALRKVHLYFGLFISPALLFFAFTGALQTFSLHETTRGSDYKPPAWAVTLAQLHKKQTTIVPSGKKPKGEVEKPHPSYDDHDHGDVQGAAPKKVHTDEATADNSAKAPSAPMAPPAPQKSHVPMKIFFLAVSLGLLTMTFTGIYMAYKYSRSNVVVTLVLVAGIVVPFLLLPF